MAGMEGNIELNGRPYRVDLDSWREKDIIDFAPRATVPGGSVVMSDLGLYQPLVQTDWRHGFGFHWYSDAQGYLKTIGNVDTRQDGLAMLFTKAVSSDTNNYRKDGMTTFNGKLWSWGAGGLRKYSGGAWSAHEFSGVELSAISQASASAADSLTFKHTVTTLGQNRILTVDITLRTNVTVSSVTFNGDALTQKTTVGTAPKAELWYILNPDEGEHDIVITLSAAASVTAGARSWLYVDQTTSFGTAVTANGTGTAATVDVSAAVGDTVIDVVSKQGPVGDALTIGAGQTQDWIQSVAGASSAQGSGSREAGAASVTMSWAWTNSRAYAIIGIALKPATQAVTGQVNFALNAGDYLFYCTDGQRVRKISTAEVDSAAGLDANSIDYKWLIIHNGFVYAGVDGSNRIHYDDSTDLSALEGTTSDTSAIYCGLGNLPTLGAIVFAGSLYVARQDGLWQIGEDNIARKVLDYANEVSSNNFRGMAVINGFLVYALRDRITQWNGARVADLTPEKVSDSFPYVTYGRFDNLIAVDNFLYLTARTNEATYAEALLCWDGVGWHKLMDIVSNGTDTVSMLAYDVINNYLWYHLDATSDVTYYIQFQNQSPFPYANFPTTGQHSLITSRLDMGFRRVKKSMSSLDVEAQNVSTQNFIDIYYMLDGDDTWTYWAQVTTDGTTRLSSPGGKRTREFNFVQLRFDFVTANSSVSPVLEGYTLRFIMRPEVKSGFSFYIIAATDYQYGVGESDRTAAEIRLELLNARNSKAPIELVDLLGLSHYGYITSYQGIPTYTKTHDDEEDPDIEYRFLLNFAEV